MSSLRKTYTYIMQFLYFFHFQNKNLDDLEQMISQFNLGLENSLDLNFEELSQAKVLILKILKQWPELIEKIALKLKKGNFQSLNPIDQILLCLGTFELMKITNDLRPKALIINEILELAKKFSTKNSSSFINGVLDHLD